MQHSFPFDLMGSRTITAKTINSMGDQNVYIFHFSQSEFCIEGILHGRITKCCFEEELCSKISQLSFAAKSVRKVSPEDFAAKFYG